MGGRPVTVRTTYRRPTTALLCLALGLLPLAGGAVSGPPTGSGTLAAHLAGTESSVGTARALTPPVYPILPLSFEPNRGQADSRARYLAHGRGYALALTDAGATLTFTPPPSPRACTGGAAGPGRARSRQGATLESARGSGYGPVPHGVKGRAGTAVASDLSRSDPCHGLLRSGPAAPATSGTPDTLRLSFPGASAHPTFVAQQRLPGTASYLHGRDPRRWLTALPTFARVAVRALYPGVDLAYYGRAGRLEYDLTLAPEADPARVRLRLDGARALTLAPSGALRVSLPGGGTLVQRAPVAYQYVGGRRRPVAARFVLLDHGALGLRLGNYDRRAEAGPLVVDPALDYSSYLGGNGDDQANGVAVDLFGNAYVVGYTSSTNFPTASAVRGSFGGGTSDAFVAKLNPAGNGLVYSTYLGGSGDDVGTAIAVSPFGNAYITGETGSGDFPIANAAQGSYTSLAGAAFVAELNSTGTGLVYSTYLGGSLFDYGTGIAVDSAGAAYVTGLTASGDFPTVSPLQGSLNGATNAFVTKLSPTGNSLVYSTYLGGSGDLDQGNAIAVDSAGSAYVTGSTNSRDFPVANALQQTYLGAVENAFVSKLNPAGNGLVYSTYLGGGGDDVGNGIAVDSAGAAYVTGQTSSANFPVANALQGTPGGALDAFVSKLNPAGNASSTAPISAAAATIWATASPSTAPATPSSPARPPPPISPSPTPRKARLAAATTRS